METAELIVAFGEVYLGLGGIVAVAFLAIGLDRVDPSSEGAYAFRPLLVPGLCLIWPIVIWRWLALERARNG